MLVMILWHAALVVLVVLAFLCGVVGTIFEWLTSGLTWLLDQVEPRQQASVRQWRARSSSSRPHE